MSIRTKHILILVSFAVIPILFFSVFVFSNARNSLMAVRIAQLNNIADLKKDKIETFFHERESGIRAAQNFYIIRRNLPGFSRFVHDKGAFHQSKDFQDLNRQITEFQKSYGYINVMLVNPEGVVVYCSNSDYETKYLGRPFPESRTFEEGKKEIYFSDISKAQETGRFKMAAAAPVKGFDGKFTGEIIIDMDMEPIYNFLSDTTGLGNTGETLIARKEGNEVLFLSRLRHDPEAALKRRASFNGRIAFPAQEAALGENGSGITFDYTDDEVLAAWRYISPLRWGLVTKIKASEAFAPVIRLRNMVVGIALIILALGVFVAIRIAGGITDPILALQRGAEVIGSGNLDYRVGTGARDEVGQLSRLIDSMSVNLKRGREEILQRNNELEAFSYSVSHDLRAPLRSMAGFSQMLLEDYSDKLDADGRDALDRIVAATQRMGRLIDDLLNMSRISRVDMKREKVNLSGLAARIAHRLEDSVSERQVQFIIADGLFDYGDENLLNVAFENLLGNAWKFTAKQPQAVIEFGVAEHEGKQAYFVRDNGAGFDMAYSAKLFSPFQRLHPAGEFQGTGIGLAIVRRVVARHGGSTWIEGEVGKGATVYFTLQQS